MLDASRIILNQVYELLGRGYSPLEIAQSMAMKTDEILKLIDLLT